MADIPALVAETAAIIELAKRMGLPTVSAYAVDDLCYELAEHGYSGDRLTEACTQAEAEARRSDTAELLRLVERGVKVTA